MGGYIEKQPCQNVPAAGNFATFSQFLAAYSIMDFTRSRQGELHTATKHFDRAGKGDSLGPHEEARLLPFKDNLSLYPSSYGMMYHSCSNSYDNTLLFFCKTSFELHVIQSVVHSHRVWICVISHSTCTCMFLFGEIRSELPAPFTSWF